MLALAFYLLGIFLHLKDKNSRKIMPYIQGLIAFTVFITKQNVGIYYLIACFIMHVMFAIKDKKIKIEIIKYLKQVLTFILLTAIFMFILYLNGNLNSFIDYCFLGISEFAQENVTTDISSVILILAILISCIYSIAILKIKKIDEDIKNDNIKMLPFCIMIIFVAFPIFNRYHVYTALIVTLILLLGNIERTFFSQVLNEKKKEKICVILISIIMFFFVIFFIFNTVLYVYQINNCIEPYFGSVMEQEQIDNIDKVCNYIKENSNKGIDTKILSYQADLYMNVLKKNNGKMDLPFKGNFGSKGEQGLIDEISSLDNTKILIQKDDEIFWQESINVRNYIKENMKLEGEIEDFLIYSK